MVNKTNFETINIDDFNHDPINQEKVQSYPPELVGRFNSFIVTAFDDSMTVEMQIRTMIKWVKENIDVTLSALDNMEAFKQDSIAFQNHVKDTLVNLINNFTDKFDDNLQFEMQEILKQWDEDGYLQSLINEYTNERIDILDNDKISKGNVEASDLMESVLNIINEKIAKGNVTMADLTQEVKEVLNGDRPLPIVGEKSVGTINLIDGAVTNLKLADNYRMADNWITEINANLENYTKDGNYMVDSKVNDNPTKKLAMLTNETTKTLLGNNLLRVRQEITSVTDVRETYFRTFAKNLDTGEITLKSDWSTFIAKESVGTTNLIAGAVTNLKLADNYRMADNWITEINANLENYTKDGNYMVDSKVNDNPTKKLAMLNNETTKTLLGNNLLRVRQEITSVMDVRETYFRTFTKNLDTGEITLKSDWKAVGSVNHITQAKDNFNAIAKTWTETNVDLNTIYQQGVHVINKANATNLPINQIGILKVSNAFTSENALGSRFIEQTFTTLLDPVRSFKRVMFEAPLNPNFTDGYVREWQEITNPTGNAWTGKKWVALGTSITARTINYANYVKDILGLQLENRGYSSGGLTTIAPAGNITMQRAKEIEDFDGLLTVEMIPNDYGFNLGTLGDKTEDTFYGCLYTLADVLQRRTTARIVWIISTTAYTREDGTRRDVLSNVLTNGTWEMRKAVKEVAELFSIPVINAGGESGLGGWVQNSQTMADNIHHLEIGAKIYGEYVARQLSIIQPFPDTLALASDIVTP